MSPPHDETPSRDHDVHAQPTPRTLRGPWHTLALLITLLALVSFIPSVAPRDLRAAPDPKSPRPSTKPPRRVDHRPFGRGVVDLGGAAAFGGSGEGGFAFTFGANAGYFVLNGLEPGIQTDLTLGNHIDTQWTLLPFLRWLPFRSRSFSPYLKATAGGLFIFGSGETLKLGLYGGGGGVVLGLGGRMALNLEGLALRIATQERCPGDDCMLYRFGISVSVLLGQAPPRRRHRRRYPRPRGPFITPSTAPPGQHAPARKGRKARPPISPSPPPLTPVPDEIPTPTPDEPGLG